MGAIYRRELQAYFNSPAAYIYLAAFNAAAAVFFYFNCIISATTNMTGVFDNMFTILVVLIPILTMRLLSDEKRQRTDQCLLTSPTSLIGIVLGKFFAAVTVFAASLLTFFVYALILAGFASVEWQLVVGYCAGLLLLGAAFISIGLFVSSLTESQLIAAIVSIAFLLPLTFIDAVSYMANNETVTAIISAVSFMKRYLVFTYGVFDISSVLFFVSVSAIFCFLTERMLQRRRYAA